jgi:hypothetical protein
MIRYQCPCKLELVCFSEDYGFFKVDSTGEFGDVKGLFKSDINIKGMRFAGGLTWYGGNYEIGGMVQRDDEFLEIIKMDADDFFNNSDVKNGNIALLCTAVLDNYYVYVAAVAYMGGSSFYYASNVFNIASTWRDADITLPSKNSICNSKEIVDVTKSDYSKFYRVSSKRVISSQMNARVNLFKYVKDDLKSLNIPIPSKEDIIDIYPDGIKNNYFLTLNGVYLNDTFISDFTIDIDKSNVFSNYIFYCVSHSNASCVKECIYLDNGNSKLVFPKEIGKLFISGKSKDKYYTYSIKADSKKELPSDLSWPDYFLAASMTKDSKLMINTPNKNLIEYINFIVPVIPEDTLAFQSEEIDSIVGASKIIKYIKD